jgi:hypothetical protein
MSSDGNSFDFGDDDDLPHQTPTQMAQSQHGLG